MFYVPDVQSAKSSGDVVFAVFYSLLYLSCCECNGV